MARGRRVPPGAGAAGHGGDGTFRGCRRSGCYPDARRRSGAPTTFFRSNPMPLARLPFWSRSRCALSIAALALPSLVLGLVGSACGSSEDGEAQSGTGGSSGQVGSGTGVGGNDADATVPDAQPDVTPPTYADLCGDGVCVPGPDDGCEDDDAVQRGTRPSGGEPGGDPSGATARGCHVVADDDGEPESVCVAVGEGPIDAPCQTAADCAAGAACIPTDGGSQTASGICRPYCCDDVEACAVGSFCAPRPLVGDADLTVPVCVAVTPCKLLDDDEPCPAGTTCSVVREDGTTSCVVPGSGGLCEPCPCAAGFVCAVHTGLCEKLCRTDGTGDDCGGGFCQGGSSDYPSGIGICVGGGDDDCSDP